METTKISKPKWNKPCERNSDHTCNEWGMEEEKTPKFLYHTLFHGIIRIIVQ